MIRLSDSENIGLSIVYRQRDREQIERERGEIEIEKVQQHLTWHLLYGNRQF